MAGPCRNCDRLHTALDTSKRKMQANMEEILLLRHTLDAYRRADTCYPTEKDVHPPMHDGDDDDDQDDTIAIYRLLLVKARSQLQGVRAQLDSERHVSAELRAQVRHLHRETSDLPVTPSTVAAAAARCHLQLTNMEQQIHALGPPFRPSTSLSPS
ncbi:Aste57867_24339 [Aphanomyces stellatus]|uniref:Aste57867_24339 protein n=1 Tax=Aphanomyces stellatus TaxID=120398 RepID=A0A485LUI4_9STRA|nr:hypothetical protein As57867_024264 [Aphanomyces stellatus]VFU00979.1 Aste57867_24339 [Aphanomyces stellatus]